jgi:hypothetical protein
MTLAAALLSAFLVASNGAQPGPTPSPTSAPSPDLNPVVIYRRAIEAMRIADVNRPNYATFQLDYTGHNLILTPDTTNGKTDWDMNLKHANDSHSYHVWYRAHDERALTQDDATHIVYRGEALLAPIGSNVFDNGTPAPSPAPNVTPSPRASGPPDTPGGATTEVLGSVTAEASRFYDITLVGIEDYKDHPVYHLHLHARSDDLEHPLTDLFVDTSTYLVRAAHAEVTLRGVIFAFGLSIDVAYEPVGSHWLLDDLRFHGKGYALFYHANMDCTMTMHDIALPASLPDSYFTVPASATP